jgi:hypothetical protein
MANDRNLTTHTYNEALAERIGSHLAAHARLIGGWLAAMEARIAELNTPPPSSTRRSPRPRDRDLPFRSSEPRALLKQGLLAVRIRA